MILYKLSFSLSLIYLRIKISELNSTVMKSDCKYLTIGILLLAKFESD